MPGMRMRFAVSLPVGAVIAVLVGGIAGAAELPPGPNRDLVARTCTACHDTEMLLGAVGANREAWDGAIDQMAEYGLKISPAERAMILDYLVAALGPDSTLAKR